MSNVRLTDERLKSYLNSRQSDRERMCLALLRLDRSFSHVEPRRPEGGPDGGRDIQCIFKGAKCFGAVGFKNNANDSSEQKREIKDKFKSDLNSALDAEPALKDFVFFTNVDLTPSEQEELKQYARGRNLDSVELFYRERIRILLDSVEGYAIRFSFLDIPLSDAEQKDFFSRFGQEIQDILVGRLESIESRMEEILYRNWLRGRCREVNVCVKLKEFYLVDGHAHEPYRFAVRLHRVLMHGEGEFLMGCYSDVHQDERRADFENKSFLYSDSGLMPHARKSYTHFRTSVRVQGQPFETINFGFALTSPPNSISPDYGLDLGELGQYAVDFYCDTHWANRVQSVDVWFDDYLIYQFSNPEGRLRSAVGVTGIAHWPDEASHLKNRPVQFWHGWALRLDQVCKRRRIGEDRVHSR